MRIGELSRRTGFTRDAIRLYEREGLITAEPVREQNSNYKSYPENAVMTLEVVRDAQAAGVSIGDLSIFLSQVAAGNSDGFDGDAFLAAKIVQIEARITASERFLQWLREARHALAIAPLSGAED
ncbi:MerR family transcriptional regulator [Rhodobacteraceae bacterium]|nr:MerR family transcriptional regulator [Paracoccaceae bacterium]